MSSFMSRHTQSESIEQDNCPAAIFEEFSQDKALDVK